MFFMQRISSRLATIFMSGAIVIAVVAGCGAAMKSTSTDLRAAEEAFISGMSGKIDPALCAFRHGEDGSFWAITADVASDALVIYDAKAKTEIKRFGKPGTEKGQFGRINDIVVADELLFVLERGNRRIQVLHLPELASFGFIGETRLSDPKNFALYRIEHGAFYLYVTDNQKYQDASIDHILSFSVSRGVDTIHSAYLVTFGIPSESGRNPEIVALEVDGATKRVEAIVADNGAKTVCSFGLSGDVIAAK